MRHLAIRIVLALAISVGLTAEMSAAPSPRKVIVRTPKPYSAMEAKVAKLGGKVTAKFKHVDAIAVEISEAGLAQLRAGLPAGAISKDEVIPAPAPVSERFARHAAPDVNESAELVASDAAVLSAAQIAQLAAAQPSNYLRNNAIMGVGTLHGAGFVGSGIAVAVIDSGIRPGMPHISLDGSVIGCEDFVGDALGCSNSGNNPHGTFVSGMISANVVFTFAAASGTLAAIRAYAPESADVPLPNQVPMIGSAPSSDIYALRVFGATGGSPTSRILMAIERAIELRKLFDAGMPGGAKIEVANLSLGGPTLFAGRDLFDKEIEVLLGAGIVPVIAAGNAGPSGLTTGSPGSSLAALTVGAASHAHNERILRRLQFGAAVGAAYRPFDGTQTAYFSSRGPNADGRSDPDVMANGFACFSQGSGTAGTINIGSGTSYATPSVSGVAALLREKHPTATATQIRNAIIQSANPALISDGSGDFDQGAGFVDAAAASTLLASGNASKKLEKPKKPKKKVAQNLEKHAGLVVLSGDVSASTGPLAPGQRYEIVYEVKPGTENVAIELKNVTSPAPDNALFGDDVLFTVHTAKTSSIGEGDYALYSFSAGETLDIPDPEPGLIRVTASGDWTNANEVSADVTISSTTVKQPKGSVKGKLSEGQRHTFTFDVPAGTSSLDVLARWKDDWSKYPTDDLDVVLVRPDLTTIVDGATLDSPERATVASPAAGMWQVIVEAFEVPKGQADYNLTVSLDGQVVKLKK